MATLFFILIVIVCVVLGCLYWYKTLKEVVYQALLVV